MSGINRSYIEPIQYLLQHFPCVALIGARQVGKSTLMSQLFIENKIFDMELDSTYDEIQRDIEFFLNEHPPPIAFDEAQILPTLFNNLRVFIDKNRKQAGQYLITGSSSPELLNNISESLAGRIAVLEIGTCLFEEIQQTTPSLIYPILASAQPINQAFEAFKTVPIRFNYPTLLQLCSHGGYPELVTNKDMKFHTIWLDNYVKTYVDRDIRALFPRLSNPTFKRFIRMLGAASGDIINMSNFARSLDISSPTTKHYFDIAEHTFFWRHLPSYSKNLSKRVVKMPKGYIRDSGLCCKFLGINNAEQLQQHPNFGNIWESFIIEQIIKSLQIQLQPFNYYYYRTHNQAEIDLILEINQTLIPIEIKTGVKIDTRKLTHINTFIEEHQCPFGLIINNSNEIKKLAPKVLQIPAGCL